VRSWLRCLYTTVGSCSGGRAATLFALANVRQALAATSNRRARDPERPGGVAAQLVVPNSDADPPVGVNPSRLGPASAPMLARRFAIATGHKQSKDPAAFDATGRTLFGAEMWAWVNPTTSRQPVRANPGRAARRSRRFWNGWSRYDRGYETEMTRRRLEHDGVGGNNYGPRDGGARRDRARRGGEAFRAHAHSHDGARGWHVLIEDLPALVRR